MKRNYSNQELCNAIYCAVFQSKEPLTRLEICRSIGRHKSPHIVGMIEQLRDAGWLAEFQGVAANRAMVLYYKIGRYIDTPERVTSLDATT